MYSVVILGDYALQSVHVLWILALEETFYKLRGSLWQICLPVLIMLINLCSFTFLLEFVLINTFQPQMLWTKSVQLHDGQSQVWSGQRALQSLLLFHRRSSNKARGYCGGIFKMDVMGYELQFMSRGSLGSSEQYLQEFSFHAQNACAY